MPEKISPWRRAAANIFLIVGLVLTPLSVLGLWASENVTDTDGFTQTVAPLAQNEGLQKEVTELASNAISEQLRIEERISDLTGDGLLARIIPSGEIADKVDNVISGSVRNLVQSKQFATFWENSVRSSHTKTVSILSGENENASIGEAGTLTFQLSDVLSEITQSLSGLGIPGLDAITDLEWDVPLIQHDALPTVQNTYQAIVAFGPWLVYVAAGFLVSALLLNPRYATRMLLGVAVVTGLSAIALVTLLADYAGEHLFTNLSPEVSKLIYTQVTGSLSGALGTVAVVAGILGVASWPLSNIWRRRNSARIRDITGADTQA